MDEITVKTKFGLLVAQAGQDPDYPELFIFLRRNDGVEIDLTAVTLNNDEEGLRSLLWTDTTSDGYTREYAWTEDELNIDYDAVEESKTACCVKGKWNDGWHRNGKLMYLVENGRFANGVIDGPFGSQYFVVPCRRDGWGGYRHVDLKACKRNLDKIEWVTPDKVKEDSYE